ncbi:unnamed protein product, partial [marine sediment metagenome]
FVFALGDELKQVALNKVTTEKETFWGTPAISNGRMVLRSAKYLYCVADKGEKVQPGQNQLAQADDSPPANAQRGGRAGGGGQRGGAGGGGGRFDPMSLFTRMDANKDGQVTEDELDGNRMADRLKTLDKDGDKAISKDEFTKGITTLFSRGGSGGGRSGGGGSGFGSRAKDTRPDRPQRPESAGN